MAEGNGVDLASIYQLLATVARDVAVLKADMVGVKRDIADLKRDNADLKHGQALLTQTVAQYHASVMGHGILLTELDERLRRVEQHLDLPSRH